MILDNEYIIKVLNEILQEDSPTDFISNIMNKLQEITEEMEYNFEKTTMRNGIVSVKGKSKDKTIGIASHGYERTHYLSLENTMELLIKYILK